MPFALTFTGLILIITGFQNTYKEFGSKVQGDFSGPGNFLYWMIALLIVGSLGYVKDLQTFSRYFMALIIIGIILAEKTGTAQGITFFSNLVSGIGTGSTEKTNPIGAGLSGGSSAGGSGGSSGSGFDLSNVSQDVTLATEVASFL